MSNAQYRKFLEGQVSLFSRRARTFENKKALAVFESALAHLPESIPPDSPSPSPSVLCIPSMSRS